MEIPKIVNELPQSPKGLYEWILSYVVKNTYIIFNKKDHTGYCTRCKKEFDISICESEAKHNNESYCPECGNKAIYKASGLGRKNLLEMTRILEFTRRGKTIYGVLTEIDISFEKKEPTVSYWISAVYKFNFKQQLYFKHYPGWCYGCERWEQHKIPKVPPVPRGSFYYPSKRQELHIYTDNFGIFEKSDLKYADIPDFFDQKELTGEELIRYMDLSLKYQSIELLRKSGFESLVLGKVDGIGCRAINWRGKDIRKILKLNMAEIRKFRNQDISFSELEMYQEYKKQGEILELDEIYLIIGTYEWTVKKIKRATTLLKAARYIALQNRRYGTHNTLNDYKDYIGDCIKLGLDIRKNSIIFPVDFYNEHMRLADEIQAVDDEKINLKITEQIKRLKKISENYSFGGLMISIATTAKQLREESSQLGHCVKGFANRIANGECFIFFIRHKNNQENSYYTLELEYNPKESRIVQCRGMKNCGMTEEVEQFVNRWMAEVVNSKSKKRKKVA